jgi:hypothetical protein
MDRSSSAAEKSALPREEQGRLAEHFAEKSLSIGEDVAVRATPTIETSNIGKLSGYS